MDNYRKKFWEKHGVPRPVLGRGREKQLKNLDKDVIEKQNILQKFINREAARNSRLKKKQKELKLREENENLREENEILKEENENLRENLIRNNSNLYIDRIKNLEKEVKRLLIQNNELYSELLKFNCFIK